MNFDILGKFNIEIIRHDNSFDKIRVNKEELCGLLNFLKNTPEFLLDRLNQIIAIDLGLITDKLELIYDLNSVEIGSNLRISVLIDRRQPNVPSVIEIFKSAYFDECEIFDMFGINFDKNLDLKRLYMPNSWVGHPLLKDYKQSDERLAWND